MAKIDRIEDWGFKITDVNMCMGSRDANSKLVDVTELKRIMDHYGIQHAACTDEYWIVNPLQANINMKKYADESDGKIGFTAYLDSSIGADNLPGEGTLVERLKALSPESTRIYPVSGRSTFTAFYWEEILAAVNELKLPLIVDGSYSDTLFVQLPEIARTYPDIKFVLVRNGCCHMRQIIPLLKKLDNVYFTVETMLDNLQIEEIYEKCGVEKLLYGSSYPLLAPSGALGLVLYADIPDAAKQKILNDNWEGIRG